VEAFVPPAASLGTETAGHPGWPPGRLDPDVDGVACACTCREGKVDGRDLDARGSRVPEASRASARTTEAGTTGRPQPTPVHGC